MKRLIIALLLTATFLLSPLFTAAVAAAELDSGAQVFEAQCIGCHINGGNIVRRGKTLKLKALQRNGMDSIEAITAIVTNGKGNMSAYKDRLTEQQIQDVAAYVLDRAEKNWR